jgi:hypothetical protein
MPNSIKYSTSAQTLALKKGNFWIGTGDVGKGPTSTTDYWNGITPPSGGYTIYLNKASGGPSIYTAANDSQLISLSNTIAGQTFATAAAALDWFATQTDKMVFNSDYPAIVTDSLILNYDAGFTPSYPTTGTTWYDLSGNNNPGSLINGPTFGSLNSGSIILDGINEIVYGPSCNTLGGNLSEQALEIWVKTPGLGPGKVLGGLICPDYGQCSYIASDGNVMYVLYSTDNGYPGTYIVSAGTSGVNIFDNTWHHIVCTRGNAGYNIYVDGVSKTSGGGGGTWSGSTIWSNMNTQIGNNPNDSYYNLLGNIGLARIYAKYLNSSQVLQNYNATKERFGL